MKNATTMLLDAVRKKMNITSAYALAKHLNVRQQTISNYRNGHTGMNDEIALRVAHILERPAASLFAELAADRSNNPDVAKVWKEAAIILERTVEKSQ